MKTLLTFLSLVACLHADPISVISTSTAISYNWNETWQEVYRGPSTSVAGGDSLNGQDQLSASIASPHGWLSGSASVSELSLTMNAMAYPTGSHYGIDPTAMGLNASSTTLFTSNTSQLGLNLAGLANWNYNSVEQDMGLTLTDQTTGEVLLDLSHLDEYFRFGGTPLDYLWAMSLEDTYALTLTGSIWAYNSKTAYMNMDVMLSGGAEPASDAGFARLLSAAITPPDAVGVGDSGASWLLLLLGLTAIFSIKRSIQTV